MQRRTNVRLPPEVNRILYIRNLPYKITAEEMYDIFGKYGAIRQIRVGNTPETRGTAFVVYEDIFDAKNACDHLSGFNVCNRYLVVLYYQSNKAFKRIDIDKKKEEIDKMKTKYGINSEEKKWNCGDFLWLVNVGPEQMVVHHEHSYNFISSLLFSHHFLKLNSTEEECSYM